MAAQPAGVVLAAGAGTRLRPLTRILPKALCPVGGVALIDHAIGRLRGVTGDIAVNLFHGAAMLDAHLDPTVHRSIEVGEARGTAGAIGVLRDWIAERDVMVTNADAWFGPGIDLAAFLDGWDHERTRLACIETGRPADFGNLRYCGIALIPAAVAAGFPRTPAGLYEVSWADAWRRRDLDVVAVDVPFVDCGTPADYLRANLLASGGRSVTEGATIGAGATVLRSIVWPGAVVDGAEVLVDAIRGGHTTVLVR